eukprot:2087370-Rhodomonas_salina.1
MVLCDAACVITFDLLSAYCVCEGEKEGKRESEKEREKERRRRKEKRKKKDSVVTLPPNVRSGAGARGVSGGSRRAVHRYFISPKHSSRNSRARDRGG